jgi:hypothetical protein
MFDCLLRAAGENIAGGCGLSMGTFGGGRHARWR